MAKIILQRERNGEIFEIYASPYEKRLYPGVRQHIHFYTFLTPELCKDIESFRAGGNLRVHLRIDELYLLFYEPYDDFSQINSSTSILRGKILGVIILSYDGSAYTRDHLLVTREQWNEKVIRPLGMGERFIIEIPCKFSEINKDIKNDAVNDLKNRLIRGANLLRRAIDNYNTSADVEKCVNNVRKATDLLHNIQSRDDLIQLYGEYLIKKSSTGSDNISKELMNDVFKIIDSLFNISSKGPHETTRKGVPMEYHPKSEDAEMLLGIVSFVYFWMLKKLERSLIDE